MDNSIHLRKKCDEVLLGNFNTMITNPPSLLVVTNPPITFYEGELF